MITKKQIDKQKKKTRVLRDNLIRPMTYEEVKQFHAWLDEEFKLSKLERGYRTQ